MAPQREGSKPSLARPHTVLPAVDGQSYTSLRGRPTPRAERYALGKRLRHQVPRSTLGTGLRLPTGRTSYSRSSTRMPDGLTG